MSPHQAGKIAASHAKPDAPDRIEIISFDLSAVRSDSDSELRWYYVVSFYDMDDAYGNEPPETGTLVVLMDGSIVEE